MTTWRYIKGSEKDFEGAPEWATVIATNNVHAEKWEKGARWGLLNILKESGSGLDGLLEHETLIAQRERVTSINDDRLARDFGVVPDTDNVNPKYNRPCKGVTIDVYDVLHAFNVTNPALQHLVKKALAVGQRGHKDKMEDLRDILASAQRAIELEEMGE